MTKLRVIAGILLAWNLLGCAMYLVQVTMDLDDLARTDPVTAEAFASMPSWAWAGYAMAVWFGAGAALALMLGRKLAVTLFTASLIGELFQFGWTFLGFGLIARQGAGTLAFPLVIFAITLGSVYYARARERDGTLR